MRALVSTRLGLHRRSLAAAETACIARDIEIAAETGGHLHIQPCLDRTRACEIIAEAKSRGVRVTAEVTPHHLTLTDEAVGRIQHNGARLAAAAIGASRPRGAPRKRCATA